MVINIFRKCLICELKRGHMRCPECEKSSLCEDHQKEHFCISMYGMVAFITLVLGFVFVGMMGLLTIDDRKLKTYKQYQLTSGVITYCAVYRHGDARMSLYDCWDGKEYKYQVDVVVNETYKPRGAASDQRKFNKIYTKRKEWQRRNETINPQ